MCLVKAVSVCSIFVVSLSGSIYGQVVECSKVTLACQNTDLRIVMKGLCVCSGGIANDVHLAQVSGHSSTSPFRQFSHFPDLLPTWDPALFAFITSKH